MQAQALIPMQNAQQADIDDEGNQVEGEGRKDHGRKRDAMDGWPADILFDGIFDCDFDHSVCRRTIFPICIFPQDMCDAYASPGPEAAQFQQWVLAKGPIGNPLTGIQKDNSGGELLIMNWQF